MNSAEGFALQCYSLFYERVSTGTDCSPHRITVFVLVCMCVLCLYVYTYMYKEVYVCHSVPEQTDHHTDQDVPERSHSRECLHPNTRAGHKPHPATPLRTYVPTYVVYRYIRTFNIEHCCSFREFCVLLWLCVRNRQ